MARKGHGRPANLVNITTHPDDGTSPVGSNEWNANRDTTGIIGFTKKTESVTSNSINITDSYVEVTSSGNEEIRTMVQVTDALSSTNYASDTTTKSFAEGDLLYVVKASGVGTVSLIHQYGSSAGAGKITTLSGSTQTLDEKVPRIFMCRTIGSNQEWIEYGGGSASDLDTTNFASGIIDTDLTSVAGTDTTIPSAKATKAFAEARANHTGTQAASTISDFDTEVANNTAVAANTAKTGISTSQASAITANTAKTGISTSQASAITANTAKTGISTAQATLLSATAGTVTASKAVIVDSNADITSGLRNVTVTGDLTVNGTNTIINSTTLTVDDKNIEMGSVASPSDTTADGGGITLKGATDKTILWDNANDNFTSSEHVNIASGKKFKVNNVDTLTATGLGSAVVGSSLTSVGTLTSLTMGGAVNMGGADITNGGVIFLTEQAEAEADVAGKGQIWVDTQTPCKLYFTDDAGTDTDLTAGGGATATHDFTANSTTTYTGTADGSRFGASGAGQREIYIKRIDANNEGVFTKIFKNGSATEVQIA